LDVGPKTIKQEAAKEELWSSGGCTLPNQRYGSARPPYTGFLILTRGDALTVCLGLG